MASLYINSDNLIILENLTNEADDTFVNDATVTATLYDSQGNEVSGQIWPETLNYVSGSDGKYWGTLEDDLNLVSGKRYEVRINVDAGSDVIREFRANVKARYGYVDDL